jgi:outer membrane immunogenic protein
MEGAMKKHLIASGALIALIAGGPAMAADIGVGAPPPAYAPVNDWSGFYVGGHAGYGWGHDPFTSSVGGQQGGIPPFLAFNVPPVTLGGIDPKGFVGGGHFGYNQQWGSWVGGLEVDISGTAMKGSTANSSAGSIASSQISTNGVTVITTTVTQPVTNTASQSDSFDLLGTARARLGGLVSPNLLLYGTGGLAWTRFVTNTTQAQTVATAANGSFTVNGSTTTTAVQSPVWMFGWVAGVGGEAKIYNSNWLFRVEYLHYDFGERGGSAFANSSGIITTSAQTSGHLTADVVRAGISYKFGGRPI